jgi:RP/EB family microtubule-associated protein
MKRYWDQYYPGGEYDPVARRKGQGGLSGGPASQRAASSASTGAAKRAPAAAGAGAARTRTPLGGANVAALQAELSTLKNTVGDLERERDFYYNKLRDIELLVQQACEQTPELEEDALVKDIQAILYSTEEGFEIPEGQAEDAETF